MMFLLTPTQQGNFWLQKSASYTMQSLSVTRLQSISAVVWGPVQSRQEVKKTCYGVDILTPRSTFGQQQWSASGLIRSRLHVAVTKPREVGRLEAIRLSATAKNVSGATGRLGSLRASAAKGDASPAAQTLELTAEEVCELVSGRELELANSVTFGAYLVEPIKNDNGAGILLLTDIMGHQNEDSISYANRLACFGFTVLVPDLFRGQPWDKKRNLSEYESWRAKHTADIIAEDIATASTFLADYVKKKGLQPGAGRLAALGFCLGGGRVIETLATDANTGAFSTGVSFYGTRYDPELASQIQVPTLLLLGDSDELSPVKAAQEVESRLKKKGVESKVVVYEGRGHAFAHRPADMSEDQDLEDAFLLVKDWLSSHLLLGST